MAAVGHRTGTKTLEEQLRPYLPAPELPAPRESRDHESIVSDYADGVRSGRYPAGRLVRLAVERHFLDMTHGPARGLVFDRESANRACDFYPRIHHTTGEFDGEPFHLAKWQTFIVWNVFGWKVEDGSRRFRDVFVSVGRGNGKTPFAAATALYCCFCEGQSRAKGFIYATKLDQAKQLFEEALHQVRTSFLVDQCHHRRTWNMMEGPKHSSLRAMSTETPNDGTIPHFTALDELHRWTEGAPRRTFDQIESGMGKLQQPLLMKITTAGDDQSHLWSEQLEQFTRTLEQADDPPANPDAWHGDEQFGYIAEIDEEDDICNPDNWAKANPSLLEERPPVKTTHLRKEAKKVEQGDLPAEKRFRRFHANQRTMSAGKPISAQMWKRCNGDLPDLTDCPAWAAFDLATYEDFSAVTVVFDTGENMAALSQAWAAAERDEKLQTGEFLKLLASGKVAEVPGKKIDLDPIKEYICELIETYTIESWAFDEHNAREMHKWMWEEHGIECVSFKQTHRSYNEPTRRFLKSVSDGTFRHGGCPLLKWSANNLVLQPDPKGLVMPSKGKSINKIDAMVALIMAWGESMFGEADGPSYYEDNGLELI